MAAEGARRTGCGPGRVGPVEPLEDTRLSGGRDPRAVVRDGDDGERGGHTHAELDSGPRRSVSAGVGEQVRHHLAQPVVVAEDGHRFGRQLEDPHVVAPGNLRVVHRVDREPAEIDLAARKRPAGVQAGQQEQIVDEDAHPDRL
jgi:hypothetical protein